MPHTQHAVASALPLVTAPSTPGTPTPHPPRTHHPIASVTVLPHIASPAVADTSAPSVDRLRRSDGALATPRGGTVTFPEILGEPLAQALARANMTGPELARRINVHPTTVAGWLAGRWKPTRLTATSVAGALQIPITQTAPVSAFSALLDASLGRHTREQAAALLEVSRTTLFAWLSGVSRPSLAQLPRLLTVLDVDPAALLATLEHTNLPVPAQLRIAAGLSASALGELADIRAAAVLDAERGIAISAGRARRLAAALGVTVAAAGYIVELPTNPLAELFSTCVDVDYPASWAAEQLGLTRQAIESWSAGLSCPSLTNQQRLAALLGVQVSVVSAAIDNSRAQRPWAEQGSQMRAARNAAGLTRQVTVAQLTISERTLTLAEEGRMTLTAEVLAALHALFNRDAAGAGDNGTATAV